MRQQTQWLYDLADELQPADGQPTLMLGGKGASLRKIAACGLTVPAGFTITTEACRQYFAIGRREPELLREQVVQAVERIEETTGRSFGHAPSPLQLAVRSGAPCSMPGMLSTVLCCGLNPQLIERNGDEHLWADYARFLASLASSRCELRLSLGHFDPKNGRESCASASARFEQVLGWPIPDDPWEQLHCAIHAVFDSWNSPQAIAYRQAEALSGDMGTAVNVQAMFATEVAGVMFTQDTRQRGERFVTIEAVDGLGDSLVSGEVTPARFFVERGTLHVRSETPEQSKVLSAPITDEQVTRLSKHGLHLERVFDHPVDVEWGFKDDQFVFFQAREIAHGPEPALIETIRQEEIARLRRAAESGSRTWVRHNLGDTLRMPTPMTFSILKSFMSGSGGYGELYRSLGFVPNKQVCSVGFLELIGGRIYADPRRLSGLFCGGLPFRYDSKALRADPAVLERAPDEFDPELIDPAFLLRLPRLAWVLWRSSRRVKRAAAWASQRFDSEVVPAFLAYVDDERRVDLGQLGTGQLLGVLEHRRDRVLNQFAPKAMLPGLLGGLALVELQNRLTELFGDAGSVIARELVTGLGDAHGHSPDENLELVANGQIGLEPFLEQFGHRAIGEMELAVPRWRETPQAVEQIASGLRSLNHPTGSHQCENASERRGHADAELQRRLEDAGASSLAPRYHRPLDTARRYLPYRETARHYLMIGYELIRNVLEELGRRTELGADLYMLEAGELPSAIGRRPVDELIAHRKNCRRVFNQWSLPGVIESSELDELGQQARAEEVTDMLEGTPISNGIAEGRVQLIEDPIGSARQHVGDGILVCGAIEPGWTHHLLAARGLVVERGGMLSHTAVVARQRGIPAVVCPGAIQRLKHAEYLVVDGDRGRVLVRDKASVRNG